jgi:hypothetical protein
MHISLSMELMRALPFTAVGKQPKNGTATSRLPAGRQEK